MSLKAEGLSNIAINLTLPNDLFSSVWKNRDETLKLLSWPFSMALFLFDMNNRRINIEVDGGYCVIIQ